MPHNPYINLAPLRAGAHKTKFVHVNKSDSYYLRCGGRHNFCGDVFFLQQQGDSLAQEAEAQRGKIKSVRDKVFKIIQEKANVSTKYRKAFERVYPDLIAGRYSGDNGGMMKWIQEQNPTFDTSLYGDLMQSIEVQREAFNTEQTRMLDIINQRAALIEQYPSCWFIRNKSAIDYTVIASTSTNSVMESGIDNEMLTFGE